MGIPFKYEPEIQFTGMTKPQYPDFVFYVKELDTCKIHEHYGLMSLSSYIRDLKMHESQEEIERNEEYSIFTYHLRPSFDFQQEILWNGEDMEVLEPIWLRKEIAGKIKKMWDKYSASLD